MGTETGKKNTRRKETHRRRGDEATHGWNSGASLHRTDSKKKKKKTEKQTGHFTHLIHNQSGLSGAHWEASFESSNRPAIVKDSVKASRNRRSVCACPSGCVRRQLSPLQAHRHRAKAGRVCMAEPESDRHGGCVAGRREREGEGKKKKKDVLPELERRARGDLRRQALRSGAVL